MQCNKVRDLLGPYIDGDLTLGDEERLRAHLDGCPGCGGEFRKLRGLRRLLMSLPVEDPGEEFTRSVVLRARRLEASREAPPAPGLFQRWAASLARAAVLRPAAGLAFALVLGIVAGVGLHSMLAPGSPSGGAATSSLQAGRRARTAPGTERSPGVDVAAAGGELAGRPADSLGASSVEFVLEPYVVHEGVQQVAVPLYPRSGSTSAGYSQNDVRITF